MYPIFSITRTSGEPVAIWEEAPHLSLTNQLVEDSVVPRVVTNSPGNHRRMDSELCSERLKQPAES